MRDDLLYLNVMNELIGPRLVNPTVPVKIHVIHSREELEALLDSALKPMGGQDLDDVSDEAEMAGYDRLCDEALARCPELKSGRYCQTCDAHRCPFYGVSPEKIQEYLAYRRSVSDPRD